MCRSPLRQICHAYSTDGESLRSAYLLELKPPHVLSSAVDLSVLANCARHGLKAVLIVSVAVAGLSRALSSNTPCPNHHQVLQLAYDGRILTAYYRQQYASCKCSFQASLWHIMPIACLRCRRMMYHLRRNIRQHFSTSLPCSKR